MRGQRDGAPPSAAPTLNDAALDALADRLMGRIDVQRDQGVQVRPGMVVRVRRPGPGASSYDEIKLETDRVFKLRGSRNDEKLVRLGFLEVFSGKTWACRLCGAEFASERWRDTHGRNEHEPKRSLIGVREVPLSETFRNEKTHFTAEDVAMEQAAQAAVVRGTEQAEEAAERKADEEAPLYLDKTAASRK